MKLNVLFLIVFAIGSFSVYSQTAEERQRILANYDLEKLKQLEDELAEQYKRERQEALDLAAVYGWPESYETEGGGKALLVGVLEDHSPLYLTTSNRNAGITARVNRINTGGSSGLHLNGENMLVGVWDGGIVRTTHQLFTGRVTLNDNAIDLSSHATHVTGTIIGTGGVQAGSAQGMAPMAEALTHDFANAPSEMVGAISSHGLLVSNHSYGIPAENVQSWYLGKYDSNARQIDLIQFNSPNFLSVFSAGNDRNTNHTNPSDGGYDLLTAYSNSKNNLVVAAVHHVPNYVNGSSVEMSSFSSWGPTDDGRIKPDISAKGVNTFSSTSATDISYGNISGTSMAAPSVAGTVALLQQHYNNLNGNFMLSSSARGLVIHTADECGIFPGPDYRFGWGLINAERAAAVISNNGSSSLIHEGMITNGKGITVTGNAIPGQRLVVTIAWTDRPGDVLPGQVEDDDTPMLINDLDIRVRDQNGTIFYPWILDHWHFSAPATKGDNYRDNVEKIEIDNPSGVYSIALTHKGNLVNGIQEYSLIVSGLENYTLNTPEQEIVRASVYPNPATDRLNIQAKSPITSVEIMNLLGQTVGTYQVNSNSTQLDIASFKTGTYFVRVTIDNSTSMHKIIKR